MIGAATGCVRIPPLPLSSAAQRMATTDDSAEITLTQKRHPCGRADGPPPFSPLLNSNFSAPLLSLRITEPRSRVADPRRPGQPAPSASSVKSVMTPVWELRKGVSTEAVGRDGRPYLAAIDGNGANPSRRRPGPHRPLGKLPATMGSAERILVPTRRSCVRGCSHTKPPPDFMKSHRPPSPSVSSVKSVVKPVWEFGKSVRL